MNFAIMIRRGTKALALKVGELIEKAGEVKGHNIGSFLGAKDQLEWNWYGDKGQTSWGEVISLEITISGVNFGNLFFSIFNMCRRDSVAYKHSPSWTPYQEGHSDKQFIDSWSNPSYEALFFCKNNNLSSSFVWTIISLPLSLSLNNGYKYIYTCVLNLLILQSTLQLWLILFL